MTVQLDPAPDTEDCRAVSSILARVGDKWTVLIVVLLGDGPKRFNEIKRMVGGISLKRRGPPPSSMMTNTLHLSPTRARIEATPRQSLSRCALGGSTGSLLRLGTSMCLVTLVCSGFKKVPSCAACGRPLI